MLVGLGPQDGLGRERTMRLRGRGSSVRSSACHRMCRFPTQFQFAVAPKRSATKNSIKTRIFKMRGVGSLPSPVTSTKLSVI